MLKFSLFCGLLWCSVTSIAFALPLAKQSIAVLYPQIKEPYNQIFVSISQGIEQTFPGTTKILILDNSQDLDSIKRWLSQNQINAVIGLGRHALKFVLQLPQSYPSVVGAISLSSKQVNLSGISMLPSPHNLLQQLKKIQPNITSVHVVLNQQKQDWWLEQALLAAKQTEHKIVVHAVNNLTDSAQQYHHLLKQLNSQTEAIWLLADRNIMDSAIMRNILEVAWDRELFIFSNLMPDVQRGALFAMYPDNVAMGKSLARMLTEQLAQPKPEVNLQFLSDLLTIVNLRTAKHIGLHFSKSEQQSFDLVYPVQ
jgi:putative ABC transport system substrate-binding protein